jgi:anti-sigma regulatory factor (Ser/Thr protein kinase)
VVGVLAFRASLPRTATASRDARHDLDAWLPARCGSSTAETALLLASELVTNAVVHTRSADIAVRARCTGSTLLVAVDDQESAPPDQAACSEVASGAGLTLVESLATRWGWQPLSTGKRVWFEMACTGPDGSGQDDCCDTGSTIDLRDASQVRPAG